MWVKNNQNLKNQNIKIVVTKQLHIVMWIRFLWQYIFWLFVIRYVLWVIYYNENDFSWSSTINTTEKPIGMQMIAW